MYESISQLLASFFKKGEQKTDRFDLIVVYLVFLTFIVVNLSGLLSAFYFSQAADSMCRTFV
jgi:hypothetical protein